MPSVPKKLIDLGRRAAAAGSEIVERLRRDEDDATVTPPPEDVGAPRPGEPAAVKSATDD